MANVNKLTKVESGKYICGDVLFERVDYTCDGGGIRWVAADYCITKEGEVVGTIAHDAFLTLADAKRCMIG